MEQGVKPLATRAKQELLAARNLKELEGVFRSYLGRKGELTRALRSLSQLPEKERVARGREANAARRELLEAAERRKAELSSQSAEKSSLDVTAPGTRVRRGRLHPLTRTRRQIQAVFASMGFSAVSGPEVEDEWHNFDALNIPPDHPARDLWDTLWLKVPPQKGRRLLLRTHTSPVQIRYLERNTPPVRIIVPGRVFRYEATDASHEVNFHQVEGLMVDEKVSVANFKAVMQEFFEKFFGTSATVRLRPSYFPFVEPGFEMDVSCVLCGQKGCVSCERTGWLEMGGAGMVHPAVLKAAGYNPKNWRGFAFGMGWDRLAMMKYRIPDIRLFLSGDARFLNQF